MKLLTLLLLFSLITVGLRAQRDIVEKARLNTPHLRIDASALTQPARLAALIDNAERRLDPAARPTASTRPTTKPAAAGGTRSTTTGPRTLSANCTNNSFLQTIALTNRVIYLTSIAHTSDDAVLIGGEMYDSTVLHGAWNSDAFLIKADASGNIIWTNSFKDLQGDQFYFLNMYRMKELSNGDIIAITHIDITGGANTIEVIYRLTPTGNVIWHTDLNSIMLQNAVNPSHVYVAVGDIQEGHNGELVLTGTSISQTHGAQTATVIRLDANGQYLSDTNFGNLGSDYDLGVEGLSSYISGNSIVLTGISHGNSYTWSEAIFFVTMDYYTGATQNKRFFVFDYTNNDALFKSISYYYNAAIRQVNGHTLVYGLTFQATSMPYDTTDYFDVVDFDANYNLVNSYSISSKMHTNYENEMIYFDNKGNGLYSIAHETSMPGGEATVFGSVRGGWLSKERAADYGANIITGNRICPTFFNDGGYVFADGWYDRTQGSMIMYKKMYDTDTGTVCLGRDTAIMFLRPVKVKENPAYPFLNQPTFGFIRPVSYNLGTGPTPANRMMSPCLQTSHCDLVKIDGPATFCGAGQPHEFVVHRNPECGATASWTIDTTVVENLTTVNDSTISITFKNINWQGKLHADLLPGVCQLPPADSLTVQITGVPEAVDLGADTTICTGNTIILHAGAAYSSYALAGRDHRAAGLDLYHHGRDGDGPHGLYRDGVRLLRQQQQQHCARITGQLPVHGRPPISKCNDDGVELKATGGFTNYHWTAGAFDESGSVDSIVYVIPVTSTDYSVAAEKWAGCTVNASVHVDVLHSSAIDLGADIALCEGGYRQLDAGAGFDSYAWNTGQTTRSVNAGQAGTYSIIATAANGCKSYDTLNITNVWPLPAVVLAGAPDTAICSGQPLRYILPSNGNSYRWSDGSQSPSYVIDKAGNYALTVTTPHGCIATAAVVVAVKPSPTVHLIADTTLCKDKTLLLDAGFSGATYRWQDGSTAAQYVVTNAGLYSVSVDLSGCVTTGSSRVDYTDVPKFSLGKDTFLCEGQQFVLQPPPDPQTRYLWQDGSSRDYFIVKDTGLYSLSASNVCGTGSASLYVAEGLCRLVMPSAFSPNADGKNDLFRVKYPFAARAFLMAVYDRFGQPVFQTKNMSEGWNGTFHGQTQPMGTYVWYISLTDIHGIRQEAKGTVLLVR
ncbi:gliding motility-associated C-terminal domain-containing protein [Puia sp. P3]|uniref:gliding motility-associated C-terminal domain-containing protein n=1 Tax=Puia sp. P3 TaxID=3423952 RepID=UPI003D67557E